MSYRLYEIDDESDENVVRDGDCLRVPLMMMDNQTVNDHVHNEMDALGSMHGYRPGAVQDMASSRQAVKDASYNLFERRGTWLPEATTARDAAYAATEQRQQWKRDASPTTLDPPYAMNNLSAQGNAMNRYRWTEEEQAVLNKAADLLGITYPPGSYAPWEDVHAKLIGLGPVGGQNRNDPGSMSRTGDAAAQQARDAAFADLQRRSENAWKKAGAR